MCFYVQVGDVQKAFSKDELYKYIVDQQMALFAHKRQTWLVAPRDLL